MTKKNTSGFGVEARLFLLLKNGKKTPIENSATENQEEIIGLLEEREEYCRQNKHVTYYYGCSFCRLCDKSNGGTEYGIDGFVWPSGYLHYLKEHNVQMEISFKQYILDLRNK